MINLTTNKMKINGMLSNDEIDELILNNGLSLSRVEKSLNRISTKRVKEKDKQNKAWAKARRLKYP